MKVLLVNGHGADLAVGGTERYVHDLREGLVARGHAVSVLSAFPGQADGSSELHVLRNRDWRESRSERYRLHAAGWLAPARADLAPWLAEVGPDLVHTSNLVGIGSGVWEQARQLGIPVVHTLHDYGLLCPRTSLLRRDATPCQPHPLLCGLRSRRLARWAPAVGAAIGVSAHVLERHDAFFGPATRRVVVHSPLAPFDGPPPSAPGPRLSTLGFLGSLTVEKGLPELIAAAPGLAAAGVRLRVAGDGPFREQARAAPGVEYVGSVLGEARTAFLTSCDAGIVPSVWEEPGLTFVALEWLAARRPVLASGRGGLGELTRHGGVRTVAPRAQDIVRVATELTEPARFGALRDAVPSVGGSAGVDQWLDAHLAIYASVRR